MSVPFLSIVIPVYNVDKYLKRCLDSILGQTFLDYELICVDDGSTDSSLKILYEYAEKDERIIVISKKNGGLSSARNTGINVATGKWILFIDSDDLLGCKGNTYFDELSQLCAEASDDVDWVVAQATVFYEEGYRFKKVSGDTRYFCLPERGVYDNSYLRNVPINVCAWGKMYKRSVIEKNKLRFPDGIRYEDEYWYPCYLFVSKKMKVVDVNLYSYFRRNGGIMGSSFEKKELAISDERLKISEKIMSFCYGYNLSEEDRLWLNKRFIDLYWSAINFCPDEDLLYIYWRAGKILREFDVDCLGDSVLHALKQGKGASKPTRLSKLKNSIMKRISKLKKLRYD